MSANNANLNEVKNTMPDEESLANNSESPKNGEVEFDSAKIKKQNQGEMFTQVKGAEKRAREAAREEAAEKRADEKLKAAEAAEERRKAKEAEMIAAAKEDARKAKERKKHTKRRILIAGATVAAIVLGIFAAKFIRDKISDKKFDTALNEGYTLVSGLISSDMHPVFEAYTPVIKEWADQCSGDEQCAGRKLAYLDFYLTYDNTAKEFDDVLEQIDSGLKTKHQHEKTLNIYANCFSLKGSQEQIDKYAEEFNKYGIGMPEVGE